MTDRETPQFTKVFITKTRKFRARVSGPGIIDYEVTVGGKKWESGIGKQHTDEIMLQIIKLTKDVNDEAIKLLEKEGLYESVHSQLH